MRGIYKITNKHDGKIYIGQSSNVEERIRQHKQIRFVPIDMWINMIGVENFDFEILETGEDLDLDLAEKKSYRNSGCSKQWL